MVILILILKKQAAGQTYQTGFGDMLVAPSFQFPRTHHSVAVEGTELSSADGSLAFVGMELRWLELT